MEGGSSQSVTTARGRTPGRWRRIPRRAMEECLTLAAPAGGSAAPPASAALPGCSTASGSAGSTEGGSSQSATTARRRTPGRWRRIPRPTPAWVTKPAVLVVGSAEWAKEMEADKQATLQWADELEKADEDLCDTEEDKVAFRAFKAKFVPFIRRHANMKPEDAVLVYKKPSDTQEEHLTAEDMEARFPGGQACHCDFATAHANGVIFQ